MDLDEAVSTTTEQGDPDIAAVAHCAAMLGLDPAELLTFVLGVGWVNRP